VCVFTRKTNMRLLFMKVTGVYCQSHVGYINILCEVNKEYLFVSRRAMYV